MPDMARLAEHWGEVVGLRLHGGTTYRAECICPWRGPIRRSVLEARMDGEAHASGDVPELPYPSSSDESRSEP